MIIDYGYHEDEFFHPQRKNGTVQFYKNHKKINDIFSFQQGSFDISISVNFSNIYRIAKRNSIELYSFTTQSEFLLNMNILELAKEIEGNSERNNMRRKVDGAIAKCADHSAYIRHCEWYLKHGDWIDDRDGEYQEKRMGWKVVVPSGVVS